MAGWLTLYLTLGVGITIGYVLHGLLANARERAELAELDAALKRLAKMEWEQRALIDLVNLERMWRR